MICVPLQAVATMVYKEKSMGLFHYVNHAMTAKLDLKDVQYKLPRLPNECDIVTLNYVRGKDNSQTTSSMQIRKGKVMAAILYLQQHCEVWREHKIHLDMDRLNVYSDKDSNLLDLLPDTNRLAAPAAHGEQEKQASHLSHPLGSASVPG